MKAKYEMMNVCDIIPPNPKKLCSLLPKPETLLKHYKHFRDNHGEFDSIVVVDKENRLTDGYCTYLIAKMLDYPWLNVIRVSER